MVEISDFIVSVVQLPLEVVNLLPHLLSQLTVLSLHYIQSALVLKDLPICLVQLLHQVLVDLFLAGGLVALQFFNAVSLLFNAPFQLRYFILRIIAATAFDTRLRTN